MFANVQICFVKVTVLRAELRTRQRQEIEKLMNENGKFDKYMHTLWIEHIEQTLISQTIHKLLC